MSCWIDTQGEENSNGHDLLTGGSFPQSPWLISNLSPAARQATRRVKDPLKPLVSVRDRMTEGKWLQIFIISCGSTARANGIDYYAILSSQPRTGFQLSVHRILHLELSAFSIGRKWNFLVTTKKAKRSDIAGKKEQMPKEGMKRVVTLIGREGDGGGVCGQLFVQLTNWMSPRDHWTLLYPP